jgi:hypothetical protein
VKPRISLGGGVGMGASTTSELSTCEGPSSLGKAVARLTGLFPLVLNLPNPGMGARECKADEECSKAN